MNLTVPIQVEIPDEQVVAIAKEVFSEKYFGTLYHWTPVTESLPETEGMYLVTVENDQGKRSIKTSSFMLTESGGIWGVDKPIFRVLAWMNLPEMWEG